jgi:hypothetical protein
MSTNTVRRLRKEWNILCTRQQKHSAETTRIFAYPFFLAFNKTPTKTSITVLLSYRTLCFLWEHTVLLYIWIHRIIRVAMTSR